MTKRENAFPEADSLFWPVRTCRIPCFTMLLLKLKISQFDKKRSTIRAHGGFNEYSWSQKFRALQTGSWMPGRDALKESEAPDILLGCNQSMASSKAASIRFNLLIAIGRIISAELLLISLLVHCWLTSNRSITAKRS